MPRLSSSSSSLLLLLLLLLLGYETEAAGDVTADGPNVSATVLQINAALEE
jgi:hypothetical protein